MRIVSFTTAGYLPLLDSWLGISSSGIFSKPSIYCADETSLERVVNDERVDTRRLEFTPGRSGFHRSRRAFWLARFDALRSLVDQGDDVLHTDLDAFWLADPRKRLDAIDADLVFSVEHGLPKEIARRWGFVLCCGFFLARSTLATRAFLARWRTEVQGFEDDQKALNHLLDRLSVTWEEDVSPDVHRATTVVVGGRPVRIAAVSESTVRRFPPIDLEPTQLAFHPFFDKVTLAGSFEIYAHFAETSLPLLTAEDVDRACDRYGVSGLKGRNRADLCLADHLVAKGGAGPDVSTLLAWLLNLGGVPDHAVMIAEPLLEAGGRDAPHLTAAALVCLDAGSATGSTQLARRAAELLAHRGDTGQLWRRRVFEQLLHHQRKLALVRYCIRAAWVYGRDDLGDRVAARRSLKP